MSELTSALQMVSRVGLHVTQYPSGKFGFVGSVPTDLAWQMAEMPSALRNLAATRGCNRELIR